MSERVLDRRSLNRALLARQLLLERSELPVRDAVAHLVAIQAQQPQAPHVALWSRLADFEPSELDQLLQTRAVVRLLMLRRTVHLMTADDALHWRPLVGAMLRKRSISAGARAFPTVDVDELAELAAQRLADAPRRLIDIARELAPRWPGVDPVDLSNNLGSLVAVVQVPPRGLWGQTGPAACTPLERWLDASLGESPPTEALIRRYLAAHGPSSTSDIRAWCGLTGLKAPIDRLRPELVSYRDEDGRELLDLPDGVLPDPDSPAPVRLLAEFDNAILGHDDRRRIVADEHRLISIEGKRAVLIDGFVAATWKPVREAGRVRIEIETLRRLSAHERSALIEEAERMLVSHALGDRPSGVRVRLAG